MTAKKIFSPKLPKGLAPINPPDQVISEEFFLEELETEGQLTEGMISDCHFDLAVNDQNLKRISLNQVILKNVKFINTRAVEASGGFIPRFELIDVRLEDCDLSNVNVNEAIIHRTEFINCKIYGINLSESTLRNVSFQKCNGDYGSFRFSDGKQVGFDDCRLCQTDFQQCRFEHVHFSNNVLTQAQFSGTKLEGMDLSDCNIEGISVRVEDLKGVIVSSMQAVSLSRLLGLVIKA